MATTSHNPWADKENVFNQELRNLLSTACVKSNRSTSSDSSRRLPFQTTSDSDIKETPSLISKMRAADMLAITRRDNSLKVKQNMILNEVNDVLAPDVITEMQVILDTMCKKFRSLTDPNVLQNITNDYEHKRNYQSLDVNAQNQYKLRILLSFVNSLRSDSIVIENLIGRRSNAVDLSPVITNEAVRNCTVHSDGVDVGVADINNVILDDDIIQHLSSALDTCDRIIEVGDSLEDQFKKLNDFHLEFKTHILKFI